MRARLVRTSFVLFFAAASGWSAVDVEVRNGDKVTGTFSPATETETLRFRVPRGALITVKAAAAKKPLQLRVLLKDPDGAAVGLPVEGKSATIAKQKADLSGLYSVEITSMDGVTGGDYTFAATWKSPTSFGGKRTISATGPGAGTEVVEFAADAGATATFSVKKAKKSAATPTLLGWTNVTSQVQGLSGTTQKRTVAATGECVLTVASATEGDVTATVKLKPPAASKRKYALTTKVIGGGDVAGDTAFSAIVGPAGGLVQFPTIAVGQPGSQLDGSSVSIPAGALPFGTSIVIATAPDIPLTGAQTSAGATVAFGPDGIAFGTKGDPKSATISLPFDPRFGSVEDQITIYTRDAKGAVTEVAKPYVFDGAAKTVSFQSSHFSSFRAVSAVPAPNVNFTSIAAFGAPVDVCSYSDPDTVTTTPIVFFVADAASGRVFAFRPEPATTSFEQEVWAGGGTQSVPAHRSQVQFANFLASVTSESSTGVVFIATTKQVFRVGLDGTVTLLAGTGATGDGGDGGPAQAATFTNISNILVLDSTGVFVADSGAHRIRFISTSGGPPQITAHAGAGAVGVAPDGGAVATTSFSSTGPSDMWFAPAGGLYVADGGRIRRIDPNGPANVTVAGSAAGVTGSGGDGGALLAATFQNIRAVSPYFDPATPGADQLMITDNVDHVIRLVNFTSDNVRLVAGAHGTPGFNGDQGSTPGLLNGPTSLLSVASLAFVCDTGNGRLRRIFQP